MAHRSRLAGFIIDCHNTPADEAAAFWSAALAYRAQPATAKRGPSTRTWRAHRPG